MVFKLPEPEDLPNQPLIVNGLDVLKQHTVVGGWPDK
jgi:hypothetical protein